VPIAVDGAALTAACEEQLATLASGIDWAAPSAVGSTTALGLPYAPGTVPSTGGGSDGGSGSGAVGRGPPATHAPAARGGLPRRCIQQGNPAVQVRIRYTNYFPLYRPWGVWRPIDTLAVEPLSPHTYVVQRENVALLLAVCHRHAVASCPHAPPCTNTPCCAQVDAISPLRPPRLPGIMSMGLHSFPGGLLHSVGGGGGGGGVGAGGHHPMAGRKREYSSRGEHHPMDTGDDVAGGTVPVQQRDVKRGRMVALVPCPAQRPRSAGDQPPENELDASP